MAMSSKVVKVMVVGGKATPGPPLGPALGGLTANLGQIVQEINEKTKEYPGMKVPIEITVDLETRKADVKVGVPSTSMLILREIGQEKGSGQAGEESMGDLSFDQALRIAKMKMASTNATDVKGALKIILGTALSMGATVEGKDPREVMKEIDEGLWDEGMGD